MKVLGISSATAITGAGIASDIGILAECSVSGKIAQSEKLIDLIEGVLNKAKLNIKDMDAIAVTIGPGSYSGLRGGLATAKAFVASLGVPLISVSTLHATASNFSALDGTVAIAVNACRDDYNFALFGVKTSKVRRLTDDLTVKIDKLAGIFSKIKGKITLACDDRLMGMIRNENISFAGDNELVPWAKNVALIGLEKLKGKETDDYMSLAPVYSHKPNIREYK